MLDVTVFHGFPWADISTVGASVVVTTNNDPTLAAAVGREAGLWLWDHRHHFEATISSDGVPRQVVSDVHTAQSAIQAALKIIADVPRQDAGAPQKPVCINETADNCGGGAPVRDVICTYYRLVLCIPEQTAAKWADFQSPDGTG